MNEENNNAYSEVIEILKLIDDEKQLEALPMEMLELLKSKVNPEYKPVISKDIPLDEQNLQPETFAILNWITQKYWNEECKNEEQPEQENKISDSVLEETADEEKKLEETPTIQENSSGNEEMTNNLPVLIDNLKWYERIKIKIIEFFKKLFKKEKTKELQEGNN